MTRERVKFFCWSKIIASILTTQKVDPVCCSEKEHSGKEHRKSYSKKTKLQGKEKAELNAPMHCVRGEAKKKVIGKTCSSV